MMNRVSARGQTTKLPMRLAALDEALAAADGRVDDDVIAPIRNLAERSGQRLRLSAEHTVVALAGATGSGKSSVFNSLAGLYLSPVGLRRPTTSTTLACVWGTDGAGSLLDWLGIPRRHGRESVLDARPQSDLRGLVLLDLPDHDSVEIAHRVEVDRLLELVDLFVWVMDPQKYADAAVHDRYLSPLARHAGLTVVLLNQIDTLTPQDVDRCAVDLRRLLNADGLEGVPIIKTSARTKQGLAEFRELLADRVRERRAWSERIAGDVDLAAETLRPFCGKGQDAEVGKDERGRLLSDLAVAAGVPAVGQAVQKAYVSRAARATGWPVTRWLRLLRPDPLRQLHIDGSAARTSVSAPTPVQRSQVDSAVRGVTDAVTREMPWSWATAVRQAAWSHEEELGDALDAAVGGTDLGMDSEPRWWRAAGWTQWVLLVAAILGAVWLLALAGFGYLELARPPTPVVVGLPLPTFMLLGGQVLGVLLAGLMRLVAGVVSRYRRYWAVARMRAQVELVADGLVLDPLVAEIDRYRDFCRSLSTVAD